CCIHAASHQKAWLARGSFQQGNQLLVRRKQHSRNVVKAGSRAETKFTNFASETLPPVFWKKTQQGQRTPFSILTQIGVPRPDKRNLHAVCDYSAHDSNIAWTRDVQHVGIEIGEHLHHPRGMAKKSKIEVVLPVEWESEFAAWYFEAYQVTV